MTAFEKFHAEVSARLGAIDISGNPISWDTHTINKEFIINSPADLTKLLAITKVMHEALEYIKHELLAYNGGSRPGLAEDAREALAKAEELSK